MAKAKIWIRVGEAMEAGAREDGVTAAEPEVVIGEVDGPVGYAFAGLMGNHTAGHTHILALLNCNWAIRPPTLMVPKVTIKRGSYMSLFGGPVQAATAKAVVDSVVDKVIPKNKVNELVIVDSVWLDPRIDQIKDLDKKELYDTHYKATKQAIKKAMTFQPSIDELIKKRDQIKHVYMA